MASSSARLQPATLTPARAEQRLRAVGLRQHRRQQVGRLDVRVVAWHGEALRVGQRLWNVVVNLSSRMSDSLRIDGK